MGAFNWDYSEYSDILHVHKKNCRTKGSVEVGDFTLEFDDHDEVIGIEIEHASEFFSNIDMDKASLSNIQDAQIIMDKKNPQCQLIFLRLKVAHVVKNILMPLPVIA